VGVLYALLRFRSPAPPLIALVGLLGMLAGEQLVGLVRARLATPAAVTVALPTPPMANKR
jgi:XapX domain-containing protein